MNNTIQPTRPKSRLIRGLCMACALGASMIATTGYGEFTSQPAGFTEISASADNPTPLGQFYQSFPGAHDVFSQVVTQLPVGSVVHVWNGNAYNDYVVSDSGLKIASESAAMPTDRRPSLGEGFSVTATSNVFLSGQVIDDVAIPAARDRWTLLSYPYAGNNGSSLNNVAWPGASNGDLLKVGVSGSWQTFLRDNGLWFGAGVDNAMPGFNTPLLLNPATDQIFSYKDAIPVGGPARGSRESGAVAGIRVRLGADSALSSPTGELIQNLAGYQIRITDAATGTAVSFPAMDGFDKISAGSFVGSISLGENTIGQQLQAFLFSPNNEMMADLGLLQSDASAFQPLTNGSPISVNTLDWQLADTDGNGLADQWELSYFGALGQDPAGDPDGDALANSEEEALGSHPDLATIQFQRGWNLISVREFANPNLTWRDQLPGAAAETKIMAWNGRRYQTIDDDAVLEPTTGYYAYSPVTRLINVPKGTASSTSRDLSAGWNLVAPINAGPIPAGSKAYELVGRRLQETDYMLPMHGYWLHSATATTLQLP